MIKNFPDKHNELHKIINLIKEEETGNIKEMSYILSIPERHIKTYFNYLAELNCPVKYDIKRDTYYFTKGCELGDLRQNK